MSDRDDDQATPRDGVSRRTFVRTAAATGAGLTIVPRHVLGRGFQAPSDTVNIATVGIGGMGGTNTRNLMSQNIVAICDIDDGMAANRLAAYKADLARLQGAPPAPAKTRTPAQVEANARRAPQNARENLARFLDVQLPKVQRHKDYRRMLEQQKDIDAVVVATPDHMHAAIGSAAMDAGKHVYVQKPLCWSVQEARHLAAKAKSTGVVTQMGNQGHSTDGARLGYEYITSGAIGDVREVHVWTNRPLGYWPQGIPRPAAMPPQNGQRPLPWNGQGVETRLAAALAGDYPIPAGLDWDLFLGVAPEVGYHPLYHPLNWRGWVDWGQGALGDMGAHLIDHPFWSLDLGMPTVIETLSTPFNGVCYPSATKTYYEFAARGSKPPVRLTWYDGGFNPPTPEEIGTEKLNGEGRHPLHRQQGQDAAGDLRAEPAAAAAVAARLDRRAKGGAPAHRPRRARDELGRGDQGQGADLEPVRVCDAAHRGDAARHRLAPRRRPDPLRRRERARHQHHPRRQQYHRPQRVPGARLPPGLEADVTRALHRRGARRRPPSAITL